MNRPLIALKTATISLFAAVLVRAQAPQELLDLRKNVDPKSAATKDATVTRVERNGDVVLRVDTGHRHRWPGITLKAPRKPWDLSARLWLAVSLRNAGDEEVRVACRVDNPGADGRKNCVTGHVKIAPGERGTVTVPLKPRLFAAGEIEFIGMRGNPPVASKLDPSNITQLLLFVADPSRDYSFEVESVRAGGHRAPPRKMKAADFFPMIDALGQYAHGDWPGKAHAVAGLAEQRKLEARELQAVPGPAGRNRYGGWTGGPKLEATGFFRVAKHAGKWWLVDPEGRLFWSHGVDCVHARAATPIRDREHYYSDLPDRSSKYARFYGRGSWAPHGYYKDHSPYTTYDFFGANLLRKYGDDWQSAFSDITHRRLRSWGLNTIANWSDGRIYAQRRTPYVTTLGTRGRRIEGSKGYWGQFPDVFDPGFRESIRKRAGGEKGKSAGDPWCLGYFVDNELGWGDETSLAVAALASPADQPVKKAFVDDLKKKYETIAALNRAWKTGHASWNALLETKENPEGDGAKQDLQAFYTRIAETYFRTIREEIKAVAPQQLYLGCRFAWVNDRAARAASKYCDVVGYNRYAYSVADHRLPEGAQDRPTIIGEFHFGALDRGMFHTGLRVARDQEHRAELYRDYVLGALRNPSIVGTHWFQYKDQATTGRGDGENYQIGFVDVCDRPYPEIVRTCREVGERMYEVRLGKR